MLIMSEALLGNVASQELVATSCPRCMEAGKRTRVHDVTAVLRWRTRVHSVVTVIIVVYKTYELALREKKS